MTIRTVLLVVVVAVASTAAYFFTAANTVPATNVGQQQFPINANALKPPQCAALNLTNIVIGTAGTAASDLILGPSTASTLNAGATGGPDCVVGGGGNDTLWGNGNRSGDVCIGGPGANTFKQCQSTF